MYAPLQACGAVRENRGATQLCNKFTGREEKELDDGKKFLGCNSNR